MIRGATKLAGRPNEGFGASKVRPEVVGEWYRVCRHRFRSAAPLLGTTATAMPRPPTPSDGYSSSRYVPQAFNIFTNVILA